MEKMSYHMTPDEFRRYGRAVIDWIADYFEQVENYPVLSQVKPGEIRARLPEHPPQSGEPFEAILADMDEIILPGITHWQSPNFFAYFPANNSAPSILGELLSAGLGVQGMLWATSPAGTELETLVLDWVAEMLALPGKFTSGGSGGGVIQDSASSATLCALLAARERATNYASNERGCDGKITAYTSTQRRIRADKQAGLTPAFVCATVGTTSSNAIDPLPEIGRICQEEGVWLHVDAAMAGTAAVAPEFRHIHQGLELADSYCFNPHKWMFTNFDCDCFYVAERASLIQTLSILPEYLRNQASESGAVIDYRDWHIPLGRRFRALKLWFVIRHYGVKGLRHHVRQHVALAQEFVSWVQAAADFELAAPAPLNLVCFRHKGGDDANRRIMESVNASGDLFLTHTILDGRYTLRMSIGQTNTGRRHVQQAWQKIQAVAEEILPTRSD